MANNAKAADPAAPTSQPTPPAMLTTSAQQAMTMAQTRFEDVAAKSREAMEMGLKAVDVAAATSRSNVDALLESSRMASGALEAIARDVADYAKQRADRTTAAARALTEAKSVPELVQMQGDFARAEFAAAIGETARLSQAMFAAMGGIFAPLQQQALATAKSMEPSQDA